MNELLLALLIFIASKRLFSVCWNVYTNTTRKREAAAGEEAAGKHVE